MGLGVAVRSGVVLCVGLAIVAPLARAAAPALPGPGFPSFDSAQALNSHCDQGLLRVQATLRALEKRPADRPATAAELRRLLGAVRFTEPWTEERAAAWWRDHAVART